METKHKIAIVIGVIILTGVWFTIWMLIASYIGVIWATVLTAACLFVVAMYLVKRIQ